MKKNKIKLINCQVMAEPVGMQGVIRRRNEMPNLYLFDIDSKVTLLITQH